ncbi:MAG: Hpt domain-containing protein [Desulfuromonadales bacterium]|nr:Hpt domain-containing protein [Desulfuromonadales bacterium]
MGDLRKRLLEIFLEESIGQLATIAKAVAPLRQGGESQVVEAAFRSAHNLKGTAALVRLTETSAVAWALEEALEEHLHRGAPPAPTLAAGLQLGHEHLTRLLAAARQGRTVPTGAAEEVRQALAGVGPAADGEQTTALALEPALEPVYCLFRCSGRHYSLPIGQMTEIAACPPLVPLPLALPPIVGLVTLRGAVLPAIDLGQLHGTAPCPAAFLVVGAGAGEKLAFLAEEVPSLVAQIDGHYLDVPQFIDRHRMRST